MLIYSCINLSYELCGEIMNNRRGDKYSDSVNITRKSRVDKNEVLYDEMNNKIGYLESIDLTSNATINLTDLDEPKKSRENYQQVKEVQSIINHKDEPISKEIQKNEMPEIKNFDINSILEEAKKNREEVDDLERKRNLKDSDYNILTNLNRKYLHKKEVTPEDTEELREIIDTITQNVITKEHNDESKDLLSDLMSTTVNADLDMEELQDAVNEEENDEEVKIDRENDEESDTNAKVTPNTFYTKSMEITEDDFDLKEELHSEIKKSGNLVIVLVVLILLVLTAIITFFILRHFGINIF